MTSKRSCNCAFRAVPALQHREKAPFGTRSIRRSRRLSRSIRWCRTTHKPYDIKELILKVVDEGDFFELSPNGGNIVVGFGRMAGRTVGFVPTSDGAAAASTSTVRARARASCASATLQHTRSYLRRRAGLPAARSRSSAHHQARRQLLYASEATVPKVTVITRKAYAEPTTSWLQASARRCELCLPGRRLP